VVCLFNPDWIDFSYAKKQVEEVVAETVTQ